MINILKNNIISKKNIWIISILIPLIIAFLIFFPFKLGFWNNYIRFLPKFHAFINFLTILSLLGALVAIKNNNIAYHKRLMLISLVLGILFLISYVLYHASVNSVKFGDMNHDGLLSQGELKNLGFQRKIYLSILISHILLSIFVVPFVLMSFYYAFTKQWIKHKKIVRFTYPIWMYVSVTGVIVYFMIRPYYFF